MAGAKGWDMVAYIGIGAVVGAVTSGVGSGFISVMAGGSFGSGFMGTATVANGDKYKVYYKSENGITGIKDYVSPGKYIKEPVDGVVTSKFTDQVFKIPDGGKVIIRFGGEVDFTNGFGQYEAAEYFGIRCGWKNAQYFIDKGAYNQQWEFLFNAAKLWIK